MTPALRDHLERRVGLALGRFADRIAGVTIRVSQTETRVLCRVEVALRPRLVLVEDDALDPTEAAAHAIGKAGARVARAIEREQDG